MGGGFSSATAVNVQDQKARVLQQLTSECHIGNVQTISGINLNLSGVNIPEGITISQAQDVSPSCVIEKSAAALAKALQSATTTAQAKNAAALLKINVDVARTMSYENLDNEIQQKIKDTCNINNVQDIHNVKVGITDSNIGAYVIDQHMSNEARCVMDTSLDASTDAQQQSSTTTTSGGVDWKSMLIIGAIILAVLIVGGIVLSVVMGKKKKKNAKDTTDTTQNGDQQTDSGQTTSGNQQTTSGKTTSSRTNQPSKRRGLFSRLRGSRNTSPSKGGFFSRHSPSKSGGLFSKGLRSFSKMK